VRIKGTDDCWEWLGRSNDDGYGKISWSGKDLSAHRLSFEMTFGEIPNGMEVLHKCDNPPCVNPNHLFLGTQTDNIRDMKQKKRGAEGERMGSAKLSSAQVEEIRQRYAKGGITTRALGKEYNVDGSWVWRVVKRHFRKTS
jgi:hypothetical protein